MRTLKEATASWQDLKQYQSLRELKDGVRLDGQNAAATSGLRSICWKAFLLFDNLDIDEWQRTLASSRSAYNSLRAHFFRYLDHPEDIGSGFDPLSQDAEASPSPWQQLRKDEELRAEIVQDVERQAIIHDAAHRRMLTDILFTFCKLNPDVGYRQGMHEIAAPVLWVVEVDAIDVGEASKTLGEESIIKAVFDAEYIEHDSFAIFGQVMQNAKTFYVSEGPVSIATRSKHIFNDLLARIDADLVKHLESLDVLPQVFLIRWIRLLFGREFDFPSVLAMWDVIFAEDSSLEITDHICLAMLLRIRWHLLDADYNNALGLLLRYPELDKDLPAQSLALDALYLRDHMTTEGSSYLVLKYTGRPLSPGRATTPPALQRNITQFSGLHAVRQARSSLSPASRHSRNNFESVLQNTAKNIFAQGERLGIGKAVRSTIDDIHKKAQEIRDSQAPSPPPWRRSGPPRVFARLNELEERNKRLAELLNAAVNELWECQRLVSEQGDAVDTASHENCVQRLSAAIARVQFVHVYLDEQTLALPREDETVDIKEDEPNTINDPQHENSSQADISHTSTLSAQDLEKNTPTRNVAPQPLADPSSFEDFDTPDAALTISSKPDAVIAKDTMNQEEGTSEKQYSLRPSLEQSRYSFILGQDPGSDRPNERHFSQNNAHASLFGDMQHTHRTADHTVKDSSSTFPANDGDRDFDFGSLRRGKGTKQ